MKNGKRKMENILKIFSVLLILSGGVFSQENPPAPSAPKSVKIPAVKETTLKNGLKVAVVERKNVPLVTVQLLVKAGAENEKLESAGLADMTASLLTKGTATRSATQIAEQMEFLGGSINTGAGWNNSVVFVNVMSDKLDQAMTIMSDTVLNPSFKQDEIDLLKSQTLDGLTYNLKQPGFLANYVASAYSFGEHPTGGTPDSIKAITRNAFVEYHKNQYIPTNAVLIFVGDISPAKANQLAQKYFGKWSKPKPVKPVKEEVITADIPKTGMVTKKDSGLVKRILILDLPNSGQAAVTYSKGLNEGRINCIEPEKCDVSGEYFPATVLNSVLGGGYSSRLNQEIRIKRGLSYGAGSGFAWRGWNTNFSTRTQTKNESAAEVAELVLNEIKRLSEEDISEAELNPRKMVLTGGFGRNLETNNGLAAAVADFYAFELSPNLLNSYMTSVEAIKSENIKNFASGNFNGGDIIIVGDYNVFKDDLAKRFPNMEVKVIKADDLNLKMFEEN
ncbi:hypothetical protein BH20ACI4_BH20ACI4_33130 [soil metagenome]